MTINVSLIAINFFIIAINRSGSNYLQSLEGIAAAGHWHPMGAGVSISSPLAIMMGFDCHVSISKPRGHYVKLCQYADYYANYVAIMSNYVTMISIICLTVFGLLCQIIR